MTKRGRSRWRRRRILRLVPGLLLLGACGHPAAPGRPTSPDPGTPPAQIDDTPGTIRWSQVSAGAYNSCAIDSAGRPYCWGQESAPTCGDPACLASLAPRAVRAASPVVVIGTMGQLTCGLTATGEMVCWGMAVGSSLGDGVTTRSATPVLIPMPGAVTQISIGFSRACALDLSGAVYCWGSGRGALGAGPDVIESPVPLRVRTTVAFKAISVGNTQTCAIDVTDDAWCWGSGYGSLGLGDRDADCAFGPSCHEANTPELVAGGLKWAQLSAGNGFTCGVTEDARGYCWGDVRSSTDPYGPLGVLGSGTLRGSKAPVPVAGGHRFRSIHAGVRHACGVTTDGAAYCWGTNRNGQLGTGRLDALATLPSSDGRHHTPQPVAGGLRFERIAVGEASCGVTVGGNLFCWGLNFAGLLGIGSSTVPLVTVPTRVAHPVGSTP